MKRTVIRLPTEVIDHLDRLADELRTTHPKQNYSRASVARALITGGLILTATDKERLLDVARRAARTVPHRGGPQ